MAYWWLMTKNWSFYDELGPGDIEIFDTLSKSIYYDKLSVGDKLISFEANGNSSTVTAVCSLVKIENGDVYIKKDSDIIPALTMEKMKSNLIISVDSFLDVHRNTVKSMSEAIYNELIKIIENPNKNMEKKVQLIILRGNSGSGKTTTGKALQRKLGHGTMLISQDVVRREMLYVKDGPDPAACQLLFELTQYGKKHCDFVILEGILNSRWYKQLFENLIKEFGDHIFTYYFDIPFDETLSRHQHKINAFEFGEKEMREWWNEKDLLDTIPEICLHKDLSLNEIVDMIYQNIK